MSFQKKDIQIIVCEVTIRMGNSGDWVKVQVREKDNVFFVRLTEHHLPMGDTCACIEIENSIESGTDPEALIASVINTHFLQCRHR